MRLQIDSDVAAHSVTQHQGVDSPFDAGRRPVDHLLKQGIAAAQSGERGTARTLLLQVTEADPQSADAWLWLASISEYPEELLGFLNNVLDIDPTNRRAREWEASTRSLLAKTFVQRGIAAQGDGQPDFAVECFDKAIDYDDCCALAWFWKASLVETDNERVEYLSKVLEIDPDNDDAQQAMNTIRQNESVVMLTAARAAAVAGNRSEAEGLIATLLDRDPTSVEAWTLRSQIALNFNEKLEAYRRIFELDPTNVFARAGYEFLADTMEIVESPAEAEAEAGAEEQVDHTLEMVSVADPEPAPVVAEQPHIDEPFHFEEPTNVEEDTHFEEPVHLEEAIHFVEPMHFDESSGVEEPAIFNEPEHIAEAEHFNEPIHGEDATSFDESVHAEPAHVAMPVQAEEAAHFDESAHLEQAAHFDEQPHDDEMQADEPVRFDERAPQAYTPWSDPIVENDHIASNNSDSAESQSSNVYFLSAIAEQKEDRQADEYLTVDSHSLHSADTQELPPPIFEPSGDQADHAEARENGEDEVLQPHEQPAPRADQELNNELESFAPWAPQAANEPAAQPEQPEQNDQAPTTNGVPCPFCGGDNDAQAFSCGSCHAVLSLSDIESIFSPNEADLPIIQDAVIRMEGEWNLREFTEKEMTDLAIGQFNLKNYELGLAYLQEAARVNPNNVILGDQANTIAIRLEDIRRQNENAESMPKGKTILVVDDSPTVRKLISSKLEKSGHKVVCACDGVEAIEVLEQVVPDLVLLDITMPRMDGYSVCKLIRSNDTVKDVPVVMISGKDGFFDKVRGRMAGTTGYITKPFGPETLMRALETYLLPDEA